ncbi:MAG: hypothetical protein P8Y03_26335 [Anaerolineales bacterium]
MDTVTLTDTDTAVTVEGKPDSPSWEHEAGMLRSLRRPQSRRHRPASLPNRTRHFSMKRHRFETKM